MFDLLPRFSASAFAVAGLACAVGPIIIHLLNRRRFRVLQWAAMDFLREALQRNRRILQMRDLLLLLMRCAAILLFGLALAQPYLAVDEEEFDASQPLHAVLVIDNSMSMGYQDSLDSTLFDQAIERAEQFIDDLPRGSRISIVPLCGSSVPISSDPYRTTSDAVKALKRIEIVDRAGSLDLAANKAKRAAEAEPTLAKRVVLISDQQRVNSRDRYTAEDLEQMPAMQLVDVSPEPPRSGDEEKKWIPPNTWISDLEIQDGIADVETPATLVVRLGHDGDESRDDLPVTLNVAGVNVDNPLVSLEPGTRNREVTFRHTFHDVQPEPGKPTFVPVKVSIPSDKLMADNEYHLMVPVVAALPVVFIDQLRGTENPAKGQIGETFHLRRLLAPVTQRFGEHRQLVKIRRMYIADLPAAELKERIQDARLVVIAGIPAPGADVVEVLREYVLQGGQLIIAAGGQFEPAGWNRVAWDNGAGILPAPLSGDFVGRTPLESAGELIWFRLRNSNHALLAHHYFNLADNSPQQLASMYETPLFFKAVKVDDSEKIEVIQDKLVEAEFERLREAFDFLEQARARGEQSDKDEAEGDLTEGPAAAREADRERERRLRPDWLAFARQGPSVYDQELSDVPGVRERQLRAFAARTRFRVLAEFDNGHPYLIERSIGRGRVVLVTSGVRPEWNTLAKTYAIAVFDRMLRSMIESTIQQHNFPPVDEITYPVGEDRDVHFAVYRPGREESAEPVDAGFVAADQRAVTIRNALTRGIYRLAASKTHVGENGDDEEKPEFQTQFAVSGVPSESELEPLTSKEFDDRQLGDRLRWVGRKQSISLAGAQIRGQDWWKYLVIAVLILLLVELFVLAWPAYRKQREELAAS